MKNFIGVLVIIVLVGAAYLIYSSAKVGILQKSLASKESPIVGLVQTPPPAVSAGEVHSADGSMNLVMKKVVTGESAAYSFYVTGNSIQNLLIFSKTITNGEMSIPGNSWSPDNKFLFIKGKEGTVSSYLVFKANGESFTDGNKYLDVAALYNDKKMDYVLKDVTGWDAPGLLHVFTNGPSYWFELASKAFLQLATK